MPNVYLSKIEIDAISSLLEMCRGVIEKTDPEYFKIIEKEWELAMSAESKMYKAIGRDEYKREQKSHNRKKRSD